MYCKPSTISLGCLKFKDCIFSPDEVFLDVWILSEKKAEVTFAAAPLAAPSDAVCLLKSVRETLDFSVLMTGSLCFEEEKTPADNSALGKNLADDEH